VCRAIHNFSENHGCFVALTGGLLYKEGTRKDLDLVFYRVRQVEAIDKKRLFEQMETGIGIKVVKGFGFCHKALFQGKTIDMLFPEEDRVCTVYTTEGSISGEPLEDVDPDPDPKPQDELIQAMVQAECARGG